ncbi:MAG: M28 family peptidase [Flavobacteriales bacterium]|nr:M28 family peptidase [Flavobacteriales bacterium]
MKTLLSCTLLVSTLFGFTQSNIICTNSEIENVLEGNYTPSNYEATDVINDHQQILCEIDNQLSTDSLKSYLEVLESFQTRNTYSDTISLVSGIGAARNWVNSKFKEFSADSENRLLTGFLQFDWIGGSCGDGLGFRNVLAVLPGTDATKDIIIIEAHMDSRCEDNCDIACLAPGMEDNGSGTALVMELARVMSQFTYDRTIVFMATVGEEHGLFGAEAMSQYCVDHNVAIKAVQNNDVVGGVTCGTTSSPPSCPGLGDIDSTQVRLFSSGSLSQTSRGFARTIKMNYKEKMMANVAVPMTISIMNQEDRSGRGGDHIPFREDGFRSIRFTSANEHGDANINTSYTDRQHTSDDVLGIDNNGDQILDEYYVDFNYLKRNAVINGMSVTIMALGPQSPTFTLYDEPSGLRVGFSSPLDGLKYRIGVRSPASPVDFSAVYGTTDTSFIIPGLTSGSIYYVSVAVVDYNGIMSPFSQEEFGFSNATTDSVAQETLSFTFNCNALGLEHLDVNRSKVLLECFPNPFTNETQLRFNLREQFNNCEGEILITDLQGRVVDVVPITISSGLNTLAYTPKFNSGYYNCTLLINNASVGSGKMIVLH